MIEQPVEPVVEETEGGKGQGGAADTAPAPMGAAPTAAAGGQGGGEAAPGGLDEEPPAEKKVP
jgi:hypothetical protein